MSIKIKLTRENHLILDSIFNNAPKSYKEVLAMGHIQHITFGKKYKDIENEGKIINFLFEAHANKECICNDIGICLFKKYEIGEITINEVIELLK